MFLAAAIFGAMLAVIAGLIGFSVREEKRLLETGRRTSVVVVSKHRGKNSRSVEVRLDGGPPFQRSLGRDDWERVEPGGGLPYVYDPADPQAGLLGTPQPPGSVPCFFAAASLLIVPFLVIGTVLRIRERKAAIPS
jgi:hypothetical protein